MDINKLPNEVLQHVFVYLGLRSRAAAQLTCKRWKSLIKDLPQPPIRLCVTHSNSNYVFYPEPAYEDGETTDINWDTHTLCRDSAVRFLAKHARGKMLSLVTNDVDLEECLNVVDKQWTELENLQISFRSYSNHVLSEIANLSLAKCVTRLWFPSLNVSSHTLMDVFERCTNLEALCLHRIDYDESSIFNRFPPRFRTMHVVNLTPQFCEALLAGNCQQLTEFDAGRCDAVNLEVICAVMKNLATLKVELSSDVSPDCLRSLTELEKLRNLSLTCWGKNLDHEFMEILPTWPNLRSLHVGVYWVSSTVLLSIVANCPRLESLGLWLDSGYGASSGVVENLPQLVQLVHLNSLSIRPFPADSKPLIRFISDSISIRNLHLHFARDERDKRAVLEAMNVKAAQNPHWEFRLRCPVRREQLGNICKNLTVYSN